MTLLECIFSIYITGIFLVGVVKFWIIISYKHNQNITIKKANYIRVAMQGYVARNGFLPSPSKNLNGIEEDCEIGYVPYKTLGISSYYKNDGFGKPFKFIVNKNLSLITHLKRKKIIIPIQLPTTFFYYANSITWNRLYGFVENNNFLLLNDYDVFEENFNINLFKNGKKIDLDNIECLAPFVKDDLFLMNEKCNDDYKKYIVYDLVAWALISGENIDNSLNIDLNQKNFIFFQTRFNIASQLKYITTITPTSLPDAYDIFI